MSARRISMTETDSEGKGGRDPDHALEDAAALVESSIKAP
jgi:hypothetical protein